MHDCFAEGWDHTCFTSQALLDSTDWDFSMRQCKSCGRRYLHAFSESMGPSRSGRWIFGEITGDLAGPLTERALLRRLANCPRLYFGGSYWGGGGSWAEKHPRAVPYMHLPRDLDP